MVRESRLSLKARISGSAQGRFALALFMSATLALACFSALAGFSDALAFVRGDKSKLDPLAGQLGSFAQLIPAGTSYGFYAPQVCSEFRLEMRLGNSKTHQVRHVTLSLGAETAMLVSSLSSSSQNEGMAKAIATSYASYGFTREKGADSAEVRLEVELMPRLKDAATGKREWRRIATYYFKR